MRRAQSELSENEAILEYVVGEHRVYCFVLTKRSAQVFPLASKSAVEKAIDSYLAEVEEKQPALNSGQELYKLLLAPIPDAIEKSHLILVPDGKLHLLPWDALVDTTNHYLVETKNISYAPSVSTAMLLRNRSVVESSNAFLGIGGLPYDKSGQLVASLRGSYPSAKLGNIPGSMDEVQDAAKLLKAENAGVDLLVDANGTKAAFEKAISKRYSIIHLAVHGLADSKNPDHTALFLLSDKSTGTDGTLEAAEVLTLPIRTNLVVLSACETAVGRLEGQEGIATLSRAFLLAGARTVISTLWSIDDTFSRFLMVDFYTGIVKGQTAGDALRNAKLELIKTFGPKAIPYRWAAYTLEGAGNYAVPLGPSHHEQRPN